jgi:xylulokinase
MSKLLLGIDIGTYSSKGVLVEPDGNIVRSHVVEHTMSMPRPGWAEQDADKVWWQDVVNICKFLVSGSPYKGEDISAVAVSAIGPCILPLNKDGRPLRAGILYGVDTRAGEEIDLLNNEIGLENIYKFSGMELSSQAVGPKILWMKRNEPEIWKNVEHITTASSYIIYKLTGEKIIDRHTASHYIPLMDLKNLEWSDKYAVGLIELDKLPHLKWSDELAGEVSSSGASDTGLKASTPVAVGAVDALSEAVSVGAINAGDLMIMYGSTTFFILVLDAPVPDKRLWNVAGAFKGQYNLAAGMATTGSLTRWFRDQLAKDLTEDSAYNTLFSQAAKVEPGAGGLLVLPYFSGERTPLNDPRARGIIAGLTLSHTREQIYRGVL